MVYGFGKKNDFPKKRFSKEVDRRAKDPLIRYRTTVLRDPSLQYALVNDRLKFYTSIIFEWCTLTALDWYYFSFPAFISSQCLSCGISVMKRTLRWLKPQSIPPARRCKGDIS